MNFKVGVMDSMNRFLEDRHYHWKKLDEHVKLLKSHLTANDKAAAKKEIRIIATQMLTDFILAGKVFPNKYGIGGKYEAFADLQWVVHEFKKSFEFHATHKSTLGLSQKDAQQMCADLYKANAGRGVKARCNAVGFVIHKLIFVRDLCASIWNWLVSLFKRKEEKHVKAEASPA